MSKITIGILVEIVLPNPNCANTPRQFQYNGHIGKVLRFYRTSHKGDLWDVEGADPSTQAWLTSDLRPIPPDHQAAEEDFQAELKLMLNKGVTA